MTFQLVLVPEERIRSSTINSAQSVVQTVRALMASADAHILDRADADRLHFEWNQSNATREGPAIGLLACYVNLMFSVINELVSALNLETESTYEKVEATAEDIIVVLLAIYNRAEDIYASQTTKISFHAAILPSATMGGRPGMNLDLKCRHFYNCPWFDTRETKLRA
ncbi:hypothetical protein CONLIGDRAFT_650562 [Coniochaeta ligniaria NRRL 30616]|uniref:Uncharacterized protein n=1 Tax=Coniochaeta ligniaria NRRL 30616 TaxID=1408157 RepID=A0A1J7IMU7_9PEZI|nr:hypothetical protein CONLIGDRAFT_650562 [Coniochaeta ligniaria NRRL 30616]